MSDKIKRYMPGDAGLSNIGREAIKEIKDSLYRKMRETVSEFGRDALDSAIIISPYWYAST